MQSGLEKEEESDGEGRKGGNFEEPFFAKETERDMETRRDHYFPFHLAAAAVSVSVTSLPLRFSFWRATEKRLS